MGVPILTTASTVMCPHGGTAVLTTANALATAAGAPMLLATDAHAVLGCPFIVGVVPQPCVLIRWSAPAAQTKVGAVPVLLQTSVGTCYGPTQAPQGVAVVAQVQPVAKGL